jgi:hypothetical protein
MFTSSDPPSRMGVEMLSRAVLVSWVAYCMLHAAASREHPILREYGVGLCWEDLRHLVLGDRAACNALVAVAAYLQHHTRPGRSVFTLCDDGQATFSMAEEYAQSSTQLVATWKEQQAAAEKRKDEHWQKVLEKKESSATLQARLIRQKAAEKSALHDYHHDDGEYSTYAAAQRARASTETSLEHAQAPPSPVFQPLPRGHSSALRWLFFLYMPPMLRCVGGRAWFDAELCVDMPCCSNIGMTCAVKCSHLFLCFWS